MEDSSLVKIVHQEFYKGHFIRANITSGGTLLVVAFAPGGVPVHEGNDILQARAEADHHEYKAKRSKG